MRILWFTNIPMPAVCRRLKLQQPVLGGWMDSLAQHLSQQPSVDLAIATALPSRAYRSFREDGTSYYITPATHPNYLRYASADIRNALEVVADFQPDIIHIHGTERFYGLISQSGKVVAPVVISIQGLLSRAIGFRYGDMTAQDILRTIRIRDLVRLRGPILEHIDWMRAARRERLILRANRYFIGRTRWDHAWVNAENPAALYFKCNEVLREPFYRHTWDHSRAIPETVLTTGAMNPMKGVSTIVDALSIARAWGHFMRLRVAGEWLPASGWARPLRRRIEALQLNGQVEFLGTLDAEAMAAEFLDARVFVLGSHIENSPNALCEAMLVGTPAVAAYTGGIPDLITHDANGILVPPGDAALLARALVRLSTDETQAIAMSNAARRTAQERHSVPVIVKGQLDIYDKIIQIHHPSYVRDTEGKAPIFC